MKAQWQMAMDDPNNPQMIISNGAVGVDLALWYFSTLLTSVVLDAYLLINRAICVFCCSNARCLLGIRSAAVCLWLVSKTATENTPKSGQCSGKDGLCRIAHFNHLPTPSTSGLQVPWCLYVPC